MPFVQHFVEPRCLSRVTLFHEDGKPKVEDGELEAVTNNTLCNALRQLASLVLVANDIFEELAGELKGLNQKTERLKVRIGGIEGKVDRYDPKAVTVPESDIGSFALFKDHFHAKHQFDEKLFGSESRPKALRSLYDAAAKTPAGALRQLDRWRRDGHRSSKFFVCTPVLGAKRRKLRSRVDIDIETSMPAKVEELRRWTSNEALGDVTVTPDCVSRIAPNITVTDGGHISDGTICSDDEDIDHKLPSPEEQLQVVALKFPAEIVAVDISGRNFDRMSLLRRSLMNPETVDRTAADGATDSVRRRTRSRRPRNRRRNTLAGTDQKEIRDALTGGEEPSSPNLSLEMEKTTASTTVPRSKSSDLLRSSSKKESPENKKSHFNTLKQWGKSRYDKLMNKSAETKQEKTMTDIDDFNLYETVTLRRRRDVDKERRTHERNSSVSSSEKSIPATSNPLTSVMNIAVKLRESSAQRRQRRNGNNKDEPHSSSGNWSASSESGRASIGSEITTTTHPKSTTSAATSINSLNQQPSSVNSRRRFNVNNSTSSSMTSEGTLTPDIIHDLHEDGETSSVYSCDTEGYYTSFHMDSGLKTLKEEETPPTPLHSTSAFSNSGSNNTVVSAENEYELFGKGSTSTTTSSAGTVCTTLRASESTKSLVIGPAVPERKSSLSKSPESSLERDFSDKTGTVKRSPATNNTKPTVVALIHKQQNNGDISPDSGHNTSSSPIESISSPNGVRSGSDFEFSESSDMEGPERIERIRVKTAINSSRIPSMCVITPQHSDDESENSSNSSRKDFMKQIKEKNEANVKKDRQRDSNKENQTQHIITTTVNGSNKMSLVNVNPVSGYATIQSIDQPDSVPISKEIQKIDNTAITNNVPSSVRAPSPSGGNVVIKKESPISKSPSQPIIKASLLPLNNMFGRIKTNLANFAHKRDRSKSPNTANKIDETMFDSGEYVTIADVRNNNEKSLKSTEDVTYANDIVNKNLTSVLSGKIKDSEYVSLNELPCNDNNNIINNNDSLERKRQGARVTLDAEGRVVYSSDSLRRRKGAHTTFEPGPNVKPSNSPCQSPLPNQRVTKNVRPVNCNQDQNRPLSPPQAGKLVIRASSTEIVRMPPSTIVTPSTRPMSPKSRGAYVNMQDAAGQLPRDKKEGAQSPAKHLTQITPPGHPPQQQYRSPPSPSEMYHYEDPYLDAAMDTNRYLSNQYYTPRGAGMYSTLPSKKTSYFSDVKTERSVTPDITRGLERRDQTSLSRCYNQNQYQNLGIPVQMPDINRLNLNQVPSFKQQSYEDISESLRISPIDPRHSGSFKSSTPSSRQMDLKATSNLESKLMSPKKSTMSNEELYAVIHKSKKKMNIETDDTPRSSPVTVQHNIQTQKPSVKTPESGYLDRSKSRMSWSPSKGEYVDFNSDIDKLSPPNDSRSRQSWACNDRSPKVKQTSTIDFKRLLLQKSTTTTPKKLSAVEQLKISKQQIKPQPKTQPEMNILDLSGSPRSLINRRFMNNPPGSPNREPKPVAKVLSPRSQWRFANPRSDVLSSTILEDCREDESPNSSGERRSRNQSNNSPKKGNSPLTYKREASPRIEDSPKREDSVKQEDSPKGMPKYVETKPYSSASQRLYAQRAQFFQPITTSPVCENNKKDNSSPPTLETAF